MSRVSKVKETYPNQKRLVKFFSENDPSGNNKYLEWMTREASTYDIKSKSHTIAQKIVDAILLFDKRKNQLDKKDIYQYTYKSLAKALENTKTTKSEEEVLSKSIHKFLETDELMIATPLNALGAKKLSANTCWCISNEKTYKEYDEDGNRILVFVDKKQEKEEPKGAYHKFAAVFTENIDYSNSIERSVSLARLMLDQYSTFDQAQTLFKALKKKEKKRKACRDIIYDAQDEEVYDEFIMHYIKRLFGKKVDDYAQKVVGIHKKSNTSKEYPKFFDIIYNSNSKPNELIDAIDEIIKHNEEVDEALLNGINQFKCALLPFYGLRFALTHPNTNADVIERALNYFNYDDDCFIQLSTVFGAGIYDFFKRCLSTQDQLGAIFRYDIDSGQTKSEYNYYYHISKNPNRINKPVSSGTRSAAISHLNYIYSTNRPKSISCWEFVDTLEAARFISDLMRSKHFKSVKAKLPDNYMVNMLSIERGVIISDKRYIKAIVQIKKNHPKYYRSIKKNLLSNTKINSLTLSKLAEEINDITLYSHKKVNKTTLKNVIKTTVKKLIDKKDFIRVEVYVDALKKNPNYDIKIAEMLMKTYPDSRKKDKQKIKNWIKRKIKAGA